VLGVCRVSPSSSSSSSPPPFIYIFSGCSPPAAPLPLKATVRSLAPQTDGRTNVTLSLATNVAPLAGFTYALAAKAKAGSAPAVDLTCTPEGPSLAACSGLLALANPYDCLTTPLAIEAAVEAVDKAGKRCPAGAGSVAVDACQQCVLKKERAGLVSLVSLACSPLSHLSLSTQAPMPAVRRRHGILRLRRPRHRPGGRHSRPGLHGRGRGLRRLLLRDRPAWRWAGRRLCVRARLQLFLHPDRRLGRQGLPGAGDCGCGAGSVSVLKARGVRALAFLSRTRTSVLVTHHPTALPFFSSAANECELRLSTPACGFDSPAPVDALTFEVKNDVPVKAAAYKILAGCGAGGCPAAASV